MLEFARIAFYSLNSLVICTFRCKELIRIKKKKKYLVKSTFLSNILNNCVCNVPFELLRQRSNDALSFFFRADGHSHLVTTVPQSPCQLCLVISKYIKYQRERDLPFREQLVQDMRCYKAASACMRVSVDALYYPQPCRYIPVRNTFFLVVVKPIV